LAYTLQPWHVFLTALAGWINRHQQAAIDFLREENRVLREQVGDRQIRLTDDQRRRLAVAGKAVGRKALADLAGLVTPDTILLGIGSSSLPSGINGQSADQVGRA